MRRKQQIRVLPNLAEPRSPDAVTTQLAGLKAKRGLCQNEIQTLTKRQEDLDRELELAPRVERALESLSNQMFDELLEAISRDMSNALQGVMQQDIQVKANVDVRSREGMRVQFSVERNGSTENLLRGQGGSVVNVLSVAMRMFALNDLDPKEHRPTLFLDEPDAWLSPDLVPRLMKVITLAARDLGFQVIVISHHDIGLLREGVNKVIMFEPKDNGGVSVKTVFDDGSTFGPNQAIAEESEAEKLALDLD